MGTEEGGVNDARYNIPAIGSIVECFHPREGRGGKQLAVVLGHQLEQLRLFVLHDAEVDVDSVPGTTQAQHIVWADKVADHLATHRDGWFWTRVVRP